MAITGAFSSPTFNMMIGLATPLIIAIIRTKKNIKFSLKSNAFI